ncbi:hypothetical protein [Gemmatimonas sp.]|nr:hypothetical protein [Gemmatimonas sp.]
MKKPFNMLAVSVSAMTSGPDGDKFEVAGLPVRCAHCRGELFVEGRAR